jgi:hypothetical protein
MYYGIQSAIKIFTCWEFKSRKVRQDTDKPALTTTGSGLLESVKES